MTHSSSSSFATGRRLRAALALTGASHAPQNRGTDGCSIPTYAVPLASLALGFARFATGIGLASGTA